MPDLSQEVLAELEKFAYWQDSLQGQIEAMRTALYALLQALPSDSAPAAKVADALAGRRLAVEADRDARPGLVAGFDVTCRELAAALQGPADSRSLS